MKLKTVLICIRFKNFCDIKENSIFQLGKHIHTLCKDLNFFYSVYSLPVFLPFERLFQVLSNVLDLVKVSPSRVISLPTFSSSSSIYKTPKMDLGTFVCSDIREEFSFSGLVLCITHLLKNL